MSRKSLSSKTDEMVGRIEQAERDVMEIAGMELTALASEVGTTMGAILADPEKANRNLVQLVKDNPDKTRRLVAGTLVVLREVATMRKRHVKPVKDVVEVKDEEAGSDFATLVLTEDNLFFGDLREHATLKTRTENDDPVAFRKANDIIDLLELTLKDIYQRQQDSKPAENDEILGAYVLDLVDAMREEIILESPENEESRTQAIVQTMIQSQFDEVRQVGLKILQIVSYR